MDMAPFSALATALLLVLGTATAAVRAEQGRADRRAWTARRVLAPPAGLWAHRGWGEPENSAAAVAAAREAGFVGVEVDVWWKQGQLRVAHRHDDAETPLVEVLAPAGPLAVWLDLKNLADAPVEDVVSAVRDACAGRACWVESQDPAALAAVAGLAPELGTVLWLVEPPAPHTLYPLAVDAVSVPRRHLTDRWLAAVAPSPVLTFPVNDRGAWRRLRARGVTVALTDRLEPR